MPTKPAAAGITTDFKPLAVAGNEWAYDAIMISEGPSAASSFYYPSEWINDPNTVKSYQGAQSYLNHLSETELQDRPEGDMRDLVGFWSNVAGKPGALMGRINIIPTEKNEWLRDYCLASIRYRKTFPDKNFFGVSIVQMGDWEPFEFQGKQYKKVINTREVHSCDIVTKPGRGGQILSPAQGESRRKFFMDFAMESVRTMAGDLMRESAPPGWKGTVHAMKKHGEISNPFALAYWMRDQGDTPHKGGESESGASATGFAAFDVPGTKPLAGAEAEAGGQHELLSVLQELRDKVTAADDSMPLKKDLRRGLDNAVNLAQIGSRGTEGERAMGDSTKQEITTKPGMTVSVTHAHPPAGAGPNGAMSPTAHQEPDGDEPDGNEEEAQRLEEAAGTFQRMAEGESDATKKGEFQKQAEGFKKMAEGRRAKAAEAKRLKEEESRRKTEAEEEAKRKGMSEAEKEKEREEESARVLLTDLLLRESGLSDNQQAFIRESARGKGLAEVRRMVDTAKTTLMREANPALNPSRPGSGAGGSNFQADWDREFKKGGRN